MTTAFLNALKQKAPAIRPMNPNAQRIQDYIKNANAPAPVAPAPVAPAPVELPIEVTIEQVTNRNRLDVFFSRKPDQAILDTLKGKGFKFNGDRVCWYHINSLENRHFLAEKFNATFEEVPAVFPNPDLSESVQVKAPIQIEVAPEPAEPIYSPEFLKFRNQTDDLIAHLNIRPADLMLMAIDHLHMQLIKKPMEH